MDPWGEEAFEKAKREDKPIFLSIGYSTCHWCHVMERESFENEEIAALMNRDFVSIKVDREERPDVDRIYMIFVQATTGSGGWPMSVWLTPELQAVLRRNVLPAREPLRPSRVSGRSRPDRARPGANDRDEDRRIRRATCHRAAATRTLGAGARASSDAGTARVAASHAFRRTFDSQSRRLRRRAQIPAARRVYNFLLRYYARTKNEEALDMVLLTLREMAKGGMNDQLGGGFHRYSVDERWFVPHFEKMLYDQAQLAISYLEAFQITGDAVLPTIGAGHLRLRPARHDGIPRAASIPPKMPTA